MNPTLITPPAIEPLTLAEAKEHLKIDHGDEDTYISGLIAASRTYAERYTKLALIEQTWQWMLDRWPGGSVSDLETYLVPGTTRARKFVEVPFGRIISVTSITTFDEDDTPTIWDAANYYVATSQNRIYRRIGQTWPVVARSAEGIEIIYKAGYGVAASDVPDPIKQGLKQLIAHLYANREGVSETPKTPIPLTITQQFDSYRKVNL